MPECEHPGNATFDPPWVNASAPKINGEISGCTRYAVRDHPGTCSSTSFTNVTRKCDFWLYDPAEHTILNEVKQWRLINAIFLRTAHAEIWSVCRAIHFIFFSFSPLNVVMQWDFTCDANRWKLTLVGTINNVGQFVGLMFAGYISDRWDYISGNFSFSAFRSIDSR